MGIGIKALEVGELEERVAVLEMAVRAQPRRMPAPLDEHEAEFEFVERAS